MAFIFSLTCAGVAELQSPFVCTKTADLHQRRKCRDSAAVNPANNYLKTCCRELRVTTREVASGLIMDSDSSKVSVVTYGRFTYLLDYHHLASHGFPRQMLLWHQVQTLYVLESDWLHCLRCWCPHSLPTLRSFFLFVLRKTHATKVNPSVGLPDVRDKLATPHVPVYKTTWKWFTETTCQTADAWP